MCSLLLRVMLHVFQNSCVKYSKPQLRYGCLFEDILALSMLCHIFQAAYLVGASQPSSMPAPPPFFDETEVTTASFMIKVLCNELQTTDSCLSLPYISDSVVRYSSILYTSCKRYASLSISPTTQSDLVLVAEHVRKTSTSLICSIQVCV